MIEQSFKQWKKTYSCDDDHPGYNIHDMYAAYNASMLRAAEIAEDRYNKAPFVDEDTCEAVADAIRKEADSGGT